MGDIAFIKYFVCTHTGQNPYSDEVKRLPDIYWFMQLLCIKVQMKHDWQYFWEPQGELIGSIAEPQVFSVYLKNKNKLNSRKVESIEDAISNPTGETLGGLLGGETDHHYDPLKGLVDEEGRVLIPKEEFDKANNIGGIAISY